jgi:hypothetical protein
MHRLSYPGLKLMGLVGLCAACGWVIGCGSTAKGRMEWVQPYTDAPRAGSVYLIRGWVGAFSGGIDDLSKELGEQGVTARVFQNDQCAELARTMAERYKAAADPEPICMMGHSYGADDSIIIARELDKVGVPVDLIITMDPVNETTVPKNVKVCYNYYMPGVIKQSNFLQGMALKQDEGATGKLFNVNLNDNGRELRETMSNHIDIDKGPKLHRRIVEQVLETCPDRATWVAAHPAQRKAASLTPNGPTLGRDGLGVEARDAQR